MTLQADLTVSLEDFKLSAKLTAHEDEVVAIVGPNGAGKTTMLRALAGLAPIESGLIELQGRVLEDPVEAIFVPPEERNIGFVFQQYLLFPHLSVVDNVAYGLRAKGIARPKALEEATSWLERFGLGDHLAAKPRTLSGGQSQRVALARALAAKPALLLLDEPLAAVDPPQRPELRRLMRAALKEYSGMQVIVTHDPMDALAFGDRLAVLEGGRLTQTGTVAEVAAQPRSQWVADLVGVNLYRGQAGSGRISLETPGKIAASDQTTTRLNLPVLAPGPHPTTNEPMPTELAVVSDVRGRAMAVIHPRAVTLHRNRPEGSARNVWRGEVESVEAQADRTRIRIGGPTAIVAEVTPAAATELDLATGTQVWVSVKATEISVFEE